MHGSMSCWMPSGNQKYPPHCIYSSKILYILQNNIYRLVPSFCHKTIYERLFWKARDKTIYRYHTTVVMRRMWINFRGAATFDTRFPAYFLFMPIFSSHFLPIQSNTPRIQSQYPAMGSYPPAPPPPQQNQTQLGAAAAMQYSPYVMSPYQQKLYSLLCKMFRNHICLMSIWHTRFVLLLMRDRLM